MNTILAIRGHVTRYKEVIELLEMMGGENNKGHNGHNPDVAYYISHKNVIECDCVPNIYPNIYKCVDYTLEEFLEKYPYKVGDKVVVKGLSEYPKNIHFMKWFDDNIHYSFDNETWFLPSALQPYEEETMEIKPNQIKDKNAFIDIANAEYNNVNTIELLCSDMFDVEIIHEDKIVLKRKKPQYPKTYDECVNMFNCTVETVNLTTIAALRELIYCRNAYWKIAGEQMGLGKPWKPDWNSGDQERYGIIKLDDNGYQYTESTSFVFPTEEMRDEFYENFKELIELCKDFL